MPIAHSNTITAWIALEVIAQTHAGQHEANLRGERPPYFTDAVEQRVAERRNEQAPQLATELD